MELVPDADFLAFLENGTIVGPGWLDRLVDHARASGAALTAPLFQLERPGGPSSEPGAQDSRALGFRCLLARREELARLAPLDEQLENGAEHRDLALLLQGRGAISVCREATVQLAGGRWDTVGEALHHARFWDPAATRRTVARFAAKHGLSSESAEAHPVLAEAERRRLLTGLARRAVQPQPLRDLSQHRFAQTWAQLANQLLTLGYSVTDVKHASRCYDLAAALVSARASACGKPFISHLVGTASVLAAHGCVLGLVEAGLLHAVFSCGIWNDIGRGAPTVRQRDGFRQIAGPAVVKLVETYGTMEWSTADVPRSASDLEEYPTGRALVLLTRVANTIEEQLDYALCYSRKKFECEHEVAAHAEAVLPALGFDAMLADMRAAGALTAARRKDMPELLRSRMEASYRAGAHPLIAEAASSAPRDTAATDRLRAHAG
jgi:hypothetical protein